MDGSEVLRNMMWKGDGELSRRRLLTRFVGTIPLLRVVGARSGNADIPGDMRDMGESANVVDSNGMGEWDTAQGRSGESAEQGAVEPMEEPEPVEGPIEGSVEGSLEEPVEGPVIVLRRGGILSAAIDWTMESVGSEIAWECGGATFSLSGWSHRTYGVPLRSVAGVVMNPPSEPRRRDRLWDRVRLDATLGEDGIQLVGGDRVTGRNLWFHAADTGKTVYVIETPWGTERIASERVVAASWGSDTRNARNDPPREADWVGLRDGSFFATEERTTEKEPKGVDEPSGVGESAAVGENTLSLVEGGRVVAAELERTFYRPRIAGRRTLSGIEPDLFRWISPFGATILGDQTSCWGRDRTPDGMAIRERGRLVPFGVTQPVGSRLGFPLIPAHTGVFYARFSLVPMGREETNETTGVTGTNGTLTTGSTSRGDDLRGTPIRVRVLVNGQLAKMWTVSETSVRNIEVVEIPIREATRIDLAVDVAEAGTVLIRPWIAQWADAMVR